MDAQSLILLGKILSPHGVRGQVKLWSYAELPYNLVSYGPLFDKTGKKTFYITLHGQTQGGLIGNIAGVTTREDAEKLRNTELYVPRSVLPDTAASQYYQSDLIGVPVEDESGKPFGSLAAFHNFGAGTIVEIRLVDSDKSELYAFTAATFPKIDVRARKIIIHPPEEIIADTEHDAEGN